MNEFKLKCSQMSLSDMEVLKRVINENYEAEINSSESQEDIDGLKDEKQKFNQAVTEALLKKATDIAYS
ncbi:MAG: hypothetical protein H7069_05905 [Phormidesmis sp. FL-bin-119]|nr:hypothetical protein [Pedobacter sp.]